MTLAMSVVHGALVGLCLLGSTPWFEKQSSTSMAAMPMTEPDTILSCEHHDIEFGLAVEALTWLLEDDRD